MKTLKFKTNINCGGCVSAVTTALNEAVGETNWQVDINDPQKILTVNSNFLTANELEAMVKKAGFNATVIN
jgi:copper chaperone